MGPRNAVLLTAGSGVTMTPASPISGVGTIAATGGGGGTVTVGAGAVLGNLGTVSATGTDVALGAGLVRPNGSTVAVINQGTTAVGASVTLSPGDAIHNGFVLNLGTVGTTLDLGPASAAGQEITVAVKQGATPVSVTLGASVVLSQNITGFTVTPTAGVTDLLRFVNFHNTGTTAGVWGLAAINQGFTVP